MQGLLLRLLDVHAIVCLDAPDSAMISLSSTKEAIAAERT